MKRKKVLTTTKVTAKVAKEREVGPICSLLMVTNFKSAMAKAHLANRPYLKPYLGMKSSKSGAPNAIPSFTNSDPSSWIQEAGHQGSRALAPALGVPRRNHLHPKCPSVSPGHLGHEATPRAQLWYRSTISELFSLHRKVHLKIVL